MMKRLFVNRNITLSIFVIMLLIYGVQGASYAQEANPTITASVESLLTEATLSGSVVTLTLSGRNFTSRESTIRDAITISGIEGASFSKYSVDRVSSKKVTVPLTFSGNIDTDGTLTITLGAEAIVNYNQGFTVQLPVTAVKETLVASTKAPLTEATLSGSVVTLTLSGRNFTSRESTIRDAITISGIEGASFSKYSVDRVSSKKVTVPLTFSGNIDTDGTLTITLGAEAIVGYNQEFTLQFTVTAVEESVVVSTEFPLTEATLNDSVVKLTLSGRSFASRESDIKAAVTISGIEGVTISTNSVDRVSDTEVTFELSFSGDFDEDGPLTITLGAEAIAGHSEALTTQIPVTAIKQSNATISLSPNPVVSTMLGEKQLTINLNIAGGENVAGYQATVLYDVSALRYVESVKGDYLADDAFFVSSDQPLGDVITIETTPAADDTTAGICKVGDILAPGESCTYPGTDVEFSVLDNGFGNFLFITSGGGITINATLNGVPYFFVANKLSSGSWEIEAAGDSDDQQTEDTDDTPTAKTSTANAMVALAATTISGGVNGDGTLATLTFEIIDAKPSTLTLPDVYIVDADGKRWEVEIEGTEITEPEDDIFGDINGDSVVNIRDLVLVSWRFGMRGENSADINGDGIVDIVDLVLVANAFNTDAAAPSQNPQVLGQLTATDVKNWLTQAQRLSINDPTYLRGITVLEQLLASLTPKETALLANYPNPFNPETWIPYQLAEPADVTLTIYAVNGQVVRRLALGHQSAGIYQSKSRAAYWDGRNAFGEPVASGLYFYAFTAGDFTATRKMLIRK